jgi:DNA-binding winged helix-turn-helix (wHTH) protein
VWPDTFVEDNNLTGNIFVLRRALSPHNFIETVPRRGYRFNANVQQLQIQNIGLQDQETKSSTYVLIKKALGPRTEPINSLAVLPFINARRRSKC